MNSKRIISFGKEWLRLKRLQLFLDKNNNNNANDNFNATIVQQLQGHGLDSARA